LNLGFFLGQSTVFRGVSFGVSVLVLLKIFVFAALLGPAATPPLISGY
jgi:hypothetical protein